MEGNLAGVRRFGAGAAAGHPSTAAKTDVADAVATGIDALHAERLRTAIVEEHTTTLWLLSDHRDDLVRGRTQTLNRLHVPLVRLVPAGAAPRLTADAAAGGFAWFGHALWPSGPAGLWPVTWSPRSDAWTGASPSGAGSGWCWLGTRDAAPAAACGQGPGGRRRRPGRGGSRSPWHCNSG